MYMHNQYIKMETKTDLDSTPSVLVNIFDDIKPPLPLLVVSAAWEILYHPFVICVNRISSP